MHLFIKAAAAFSILAASFLGSLWALNYFSPLCPQGITIALRRPFTKIAGEAYAAASPEFDTVADFVDNPTRSNLLVCENKRLLGPMHTQHNEIVKDGRGRYSHWRAMGFVFSSSDGTDPNSNGRNYWVVQPR